MMKSTRPAIPSQGIGKLLLTVDEAAQVLNLSRSLMYDLLNTNQIASFKIGRARRVPVTALSSYVNHQMAIQGGMS